MKILIAPMGAATPTAGPFTRARAIAFEAIKQGHTVAFCAAEEVNYRPIDGVKNYYCPIPKLFGKVPFAIAKRIFPIIQKLKLQEKKEIVSFEQVLYISGAIAGNFFETDVNWIRKAINKFKPDVIFAEFRPAAIVAAKLENIKVVTDHSFPTQKTYASSPKYSKNVKLFLKKNNLPEIESVLDIFDWADEKIITSSFSLEPFNQKNVHFVGPLIKTNISTIKSTEKNIIFYMGSGTISSIKTINVAVNAFKNSDYQVYIASDLNPKENYPQNIHINTRFDFNKLMPNCVAFINHGGQNSIMTGLIYGVPQIIFPGKVFERKYNAESIKTANAGFYLNENKFNAKTIYSTIKNIELNNAFKNNAKKLGEELLELGGAAKVIDVFENITTHNEEPR